jgi:acetyltransferase-like isoleucine patch superfamily enzyme
LISLDSIIIVWGEKMETIRSVLYSFRKKYVLTPYYRRCFCYAGKRLSVYGRIRVKGKVSVGNDVTLNYGSELLAQENGVIKIGDNVYFHGRIISTCGVEIGNDVIVSRLATIIDHDGYGIDGNPPSEKPVKICSHVWIGMRAMILKGVTIGEHAIVGANAVVTKDVEPNTIVAGNPAHKIRSTTGFTRKEAFGLRS